MKMVRTKNGNSRHLRGLFLTLAFLGAISIFYCSSDHGNSTETIHESTRPERIISLAPSITEILFAIGAGDRVVGVTDFCFHPPEASDIPRVGGILNPSTETILSLDPDLIISKPETQTIVKLCDDFQIPHMAVRDDSLQRIRDTIAAIADRTGEKDNGESLVKRLDSELASIRDSVEPLPRRRILMVVGRSPRTLQEIYTVGGKSFLSELIEIAGGVNIFGDVDIGYPVVSKEEIIDRAPEFILEMAPGVTIDDEETSIRKELWSVLGSIPAVEKDQIVILGHDHLLVPGPRVVETCRTLADLFYAELKEGNP